MYKIMGNESKYVGDLTYDFVYNTEKILMSNTDLGMEDIHRISNLIAAQYGNSMSKFSQDYGDDIIKYHKEVYGE